MLSGPPRARTDDLARRLGVQATPVSLPTTAAPPASASGGTRARRRPPPSVSAAPGWAEPSLLGRQSRGRVAAVAPVGGGSLRLTSALSHLTPLLQPARLLGLLGRLAACVTVWCAWVVGAHVVKLVRARSCLYVSVLRAKTRKMTSNTHTLHALAAGPPGARPRVRRARFGACRAQSCCYCPGRPARGNSPPEGPGRAPSGQRDAHCPAPPQVGWRLYSGET